MTEKYKSSGAGIKIVIFGIVSLMTLSYLNDPSLFYSALKTVVPIILFMLVYFTATDIYLTSIKIEDASQLIYQCQTLKKRKISISSILKIERVRQFFVFKYSGSRMKITYMSKDGNQDSFLITEANFSKKTIKAFVQRLMQIKPTINLADQYVDLIEGKYESKNFHRVPAPIYGIDRLDNK